MKSIVKALLHSIPYVSYLKSQVESLRSLRESAGCHAPGHYYSAIPSDSDIQRKLDRPLFNMAHINLNHEEQFALLENYKSFYNDINFPEQSSTKSRFYYDQQVFCYSDAIFLACFLKHFSPKKIIEIGAGFSSAVILDTHTPDSYEIIEPYPERLHSILKQGDDKRFKLNKTILQEIPLETFQQLEEGDLLFIDSTHVYKSGSDVEVIFNTILPSLKTGVYVHLHDIFHHFEYPREWLKTGRHWNECYYLKAFLTNNNQWRIILFGDYLNKTCPDFINKHLPLCAKNHGGSIYMQKTY